MKRKLRHPRLLVAMLMCCAMGLTACGPPKLYERHVEPAFDSTGKPRPGYATLNLEFLDALEADLTACHQAAGR